MWEIDCSNIGITFRHDWINWLIYSCFKFRVLTTNKSHLFYLFACLFVCLFYHFDLSYSFSKCHRSSAPLLKTLSSCFLRLLQAFSNSHSSSFSEIDVGFPPWPCYIFILENTPKLTCLKKQAIQGGTGAEEWEGLFSRLGFATSWLYYQTREDQRGLHFSYLWN